MPLMTLSRTISDWIMKLGPVGVYYGFEQYEYSLISTPNKLLLFVLARDVTKFKVSTSDVHRNKSESVIYSGFACLGCNAKCMSCIRRCDCVEDNNMIDDSKLLPEISSTERRQDTRGLTAWRR